MKSSIYKAKGSPHFMISGVSYNGRTMAGSRFRKRRHRHEEQTCAGHGGGAEERGGRNRESSTNIHTPPRVKHICSWEAAIWHSLLNSALCDDLRVGCRGGMEGRLYRGRFTLCAVLYLVAQ